MIEPHTGIEIGDHDSGRAGRQAPGGDGVYRGGLRVLQVPLSAEQRIIRRAQRVPARVDLHEFDLRIGAQSRQGLRRALPRARRDTQQVHARGDVSRLGDGKSVARGERCDAPGLRLVRGHLGARAQPHDEALDARASGRRRCLGGRRGSHGLHLGKGREQHRAERAQTRSRGKHESDDTGRRSRRPAFNAQRVTGFAFRKGSAA